MFCCWKNLCCYLTSHTEWHWLSHQRLRSFLMEHPRLILFLMLLSHLPPQCPINDYIRTSLCPKSRSLVNKFSRFQCSYSSTFDVICITKTWLTNFIYDKEILPKVYTLYRKNRVTRGGGVLIAVNMWLSIILETDFSSCFLSNCVELVWSFIKRTILHAIIICGFVWSQKYESNSHPIPNGLILRFVTQSQMPAHS